MNKFSLQRVADKEINSVLMQVQDALNLLASQQTKTDPVPKSVATTASTLTALTMRLSRGDYNGFYSSRYAVLANTWCTVLFGGTHTSVPNFTVTCRADADFNRVLDNYSIRNITLTGFEIFVPEACNLELVEYNTAEPRSATVIMGESL